MGIKISAEAPPNWERLQKKFGFGDWSTGPIVTYGDTVYFHKGGLPLDLQVHEAVHIVRQGIYGVIEWWEEYYHNPKFRLDEEVMAYRAQRDYIEKHIGNRTKAKQKIDFIHKSMADMYGDMCTLEQARELV